MENSTLAAELESALHRVLSRRKFVGPGHVHVSRSPDEHNPYFVVVIDLDAAHVVSQFFYKAPAFTIDREPVIWTIRPTHARGIVAELVHAGS
jgi:hypothetical protein